MVFDRSDFGLLQGEILGCSEHASKEKGGTGESSLGQRSRSDRDNTEEGTYYSHPMNWERGRFEDRYRRNRGE